MVGGFEPSRLYIFGGGSGAGKSTILNNCIVRSCNSTQILMEENAHIVKPGEISRAFIYVTMENTIEESLMRTYQPMFDKKSSDMLSDVAKGVDIKKQICEVLLKNGSTIIMKYFAPMSISAIDLMGVVDDVIEQYGKERIAGLYIDYLDLLKTDTKYDMYRLELGHITLSLKTLAVQYNIPVITASQLGRKIYSIDDSRDLNLDQMSESIKKVEHADFVMLLGKDKHNNKLIHAKIGKYRSGQSNVSLDFTVDFERFKFMDCQYASNNEKPDASKPAATCFDGFGDYKF
jgi:replicative DNA helicase